MRKFILKKQGKVSALKLENKKDNLKLRENQVIVKHNYISLCYSDILFRNGSYPLDSDKLPTLLGFDGIGVIEDVHPTVKNYKKGDRVGYICEPIGSYLEKRIVNSYNLINLPPEINDQQAAAVLHKGLIAHELLFRVVNLTKNKTILVLAAAGGIGHILVSWLSSVGVNVIGAVGSDHKKSFAENIGCKHVINYETENITERIKEITKGKGVDFVFDGVGQKVFLQSLYCLKGMGIYVSYGDASGSVNNLDLNHLIYNSLSISKFNFRTYLSYRPEAIFASIKLFDLVKERKIIPKINEYGFKDMRKAHQDMEDRKIIGSAILNFNDN